MKRTDIFVGLFVALIVGLAVAPFASSAPDGLEKVAQEKGFSRQAQSEGAVPSLFPDYALGGKTALGPKVETGIAGFVGTLALYLLGCAMARAIARKPRGESGVAVSSPDFRV